MEKKKKILFVTGSRGEWGYIRPLLNLCQEHPQWDYSLCVTNMHLLPAFGKTVNEIEQDGFDVHHRIYMSLDAYDHFSMAKSLGIFLTSFADVVASERPDWIMLAGDRGEQLGAAIVGAFCYIPIAHIQAGEISGNIDGMTRHAIGKYSHLHFCSNQDAFDRLVKLGEEPFRIHQVGAPQLDELVDGKYTEKEALEKKYSLDLNTPFLLCVLHPTTEELNKLEYQVEEMVSAVNDFPLQKIFILPNNDAGSFLIRRGIELNRKGKSHIYSNLSREDYIGLLKEAECLVGNSSSGLIEAPTFFTPVVNIGRRQLGRVRGKNVIDVSFDKNEITEAIKQAIHPDFQRNLFQKPDFPYGDGKSSERILSILEGQQATDKLLTKALTY